MTFAMDTTYSIDVKSTESTTATLSQSSFSPQWESATTVSGLPPSIPKSQVYYWSTLWQFGEAEALEELRDGGGMRFDDPADAVRWLFSCDE